MVHYLLGFAVAVFIWTCVLPLVIATGFWFVVMAALVYRAVYNRIGGGA